MTSLYKASRTFEAGTELPVVSTQLDSVRTYQFECRFEGVPGNETSLTTAAKQVSPIAGATDEIVVDRVNDKMYYPGKFTPEAVTITFDNQLLTDTTPSLWAWFTQTYDPITGEVAALSPPGGGGTGNLKANRLRILELDNSNEPFASIELYGVYPQGISFSEKNYSTNEFSTVEVTFRYDFLGYKRD
tara:strand:+ start:1888 stop:2451 length:564 start_codon:yes stop_codon:yes gene_type:complete